MNPLLALRLALAGLRRDVPTSAAATVILALGMAAPATFFSILWGGGLRPLPVPGGDRIMRVEVLDARGAGRAAPVSFRDAASLTGVPGVEETGAFRTLQLGLTAREVGTLPVSGAIMTPSTFELLRVPPLLGRIPEGPEARSAVVLGQGVWQRQFQGDPDVLGTTLLVDGLPRTVVAVMPDGFAFPFRQDAWLLSDFGEPDEGTDVEPVIRLAEGVGPERVQERLTARWRGGDEARAAEERGAVARVRPFTRGRGEAGEAWAYLGLVLVGMCLLVIACANAANLLLVRALQRLRTLGVQSAMGATRGHLSAQLFLEAFLLASAGGVLGLYLAHLMTSWIQRVMGPENFGYYWMRVTVDTPAVVFTGILVLGAAVAAGTLPVVRVLRTDLQRVLKAGGEPAFHGPFRGWSWGRVFVTGQLALSCFALAAAGLTAGAMRTAARFGAGLPGDEILVASFSLDSAAFPGEEARRETLRAIAASLEEVPGARSTAVALGAPGYREPWSLVEVVGASEAEGPAGDRVSVNAVTPGFFPSLGLDLLQGRLLSPDDAWGGVPVAVVNESFALRWGSVSDPLEMAVRIPALDSARDYQVVGVVSDPGLNGGPRIREDAVYLPLDQAGASGGVVLARGLVTPVLAREVRSAVAGWDPRVAVSELRTLEDAHRFMTRAPATLSSLALTGGVAGLLVAAMGLYALLSFRVRRARRELGVRLALGADGARLARDVVSAALGQLLPAVAVGLGLAWLAAPLLGVLLLGGDPRSPGAYAAVAAVFLGTGLVAALGPALRASRVEPARVLGEE